MKVFVRLSIGHDLMAGLELNYCLSGALDNALASATIFFVKLSEHISIILRDYCDRLLSIMGLLSI